MKKYLMVILALALFCSMAEAREIYVTNNTVSFNTVGQIVTFNTIMNKILVVNESSSEAVTVQFDGAKIGWNTGKTTYTLPTIASSFKIDPSASLSIEVSTERIGRIASSATGSGWIRYIATSDRRTTDNTVAMLDY